MKKSNSRKILILFIINSIILTLFTPSIMSYDQQNNTEKLIQVRVLDTITGKDTNYYITYEKFQELIYLMNDKITAKSFSQQMIEKLYFLKNHGLVSDNSVKKLSFQYRSNEEQLNRFGRLPLPSDSSVINIFSGTFFGMKGEKESSLLNLEVIRLPFFDGNITGGFLGYGKFTGNGSVFTVGFVGFKYNYDFDKTKYGFPYFPVISGSILGFSGILLEVSALGSSVPSDMKGTYLFGVGMSIFTSWKIQ